ncbi:unnamed protein product [Gadus morhua 'NCC']
MVETLHLRVRMEPEALGGARDHFNLTGTFHCIRDYNSHLPPSNAGTSSVSTHRFIHTAYDCNSQRPAAVDRELHHRALGVTVVPDCRSQRRVVSWEGAGGRRGVRRGAVRWTNGEERSQHRATWPPSAAG